MPETSDLIICILPTWLEGQAAFQRLLAESNKFFIFLTRIHAPPLKLGAFLVKKRVPGFVREGATGINSPLRYIQLPGTVL